MYLFRAFAYQLQPLETFHPDLQPEVMVLFEAHAPAAVAAGATLQRELALAWCCHPNDVEYYNLCSADELRRDYGDEAPGDAALWVTGHDHGPLFQPLDRTLLFVRPLTLRRLLQARQATLPLRALQRAAARQAAADDSRRRRTRHYVMADIAQALRNQPRAGA